MLYPEAGGSSSFARHAFNELASFLAGWAQMLTYIVTAAISAFFVPHYLAVFWEPLGHGPGDVIFGIGLLACLALLNVKGTEESARLNLVLAIADLATQVVLVVIGLAARPQPGPARLADRPRHGADLGRLPARDRGRDGRLHRDRDDLEHVRGGARRRTGRSRAGPGSWCSRWSGSTRSCRRSRSRRCRSPRAPGGEFTTELGTTYADDPVLGIVENIGLSAALTDVLRVYVGVLAAVILLIATNAALIGLSRLTFSMGQHRQLPEMLRAGPPAVQDAVHRDHRLLRASRRWSWRRARPPSWARSTPSGRRSRSRSPTSR